MDNTLHHCRICGKTVSNTGQNIASHVVRKHKVDFIEYLYTCYEQTNTSFEIQSCGFCSKDAVPNIDGDYKNNKFELNYKKGYTCKTQECKDAISLSILGIPYDFVSYQRVGSRSEYISKLNKIDLESAKSRKRDTHRVIQDKDKTDLKGYTLRYGEDQGLLKYKERCKKISDSNKPDWYIKKFGEHEGLIKWYAYLEKLKRHVSGVSISKSQNCVNECLGRLDLKFISEFEFDKRHHGRKVDYYIKKQNVAIEYFGTYWHTQPTFYEPNYWHKNIKMTASEIWEKDKQRKIDICQSLDCSILIIWESYKINDDEIMDCIQQLSKNKYKIHELF